MASKKEQVIGGTLSIEPFLLSIALALTAASVISFCIARRFSGVVALRALPVARALILTVFLDSWLFVFSSTVLQSSFGLNSSPRACDAGILLCLVCYLSSKFIYWFLVEKVYIIRGHRSRWKDRLYIFNMFGMMVPYCVVIGLTFAYRNSTLVEGGQCMIGLKLQANIPLLIFDLIINIYLTYLFLIPLQALWSFRNGVQQKQQRLHLVAKRTFIGAAATLCSTMANLTALLVLRGKEPGWVCFSACNADVLFSVIVLHWVTHQDDDPPNDIRSRCRECDRSIVRPPYSMNSTPFDKPHGIDLEHGRHFGGQVVTNCEGGGLQEVTNKSLPRVGIMTKTEFHRDVSNATYTDETYGASSSYDKIRAETKNDRAKDLPLRPE